MGYKKDQSWPGETFRPESPRPAKESNPPPLPPRTNTAHLSPSEQPPPPYKAFPTTYHSQPLTHSWTAQDPRSSSTQSLVPLGNEDDGNRILLLIFIHGFMGNETSFQSFPAHIHNLVAVKLADTHVVHTKIYPRYKSRGAIELASDAFSNWLCPHESPTTDVILLCHSMGGILAAEVALLPPYSPTSLDPFRHRIVGTINFDTPFLGMHPGVIVSGLGSIFKPASESPGHKSQPVDESNSTLLPIAPMYGAASVLPPSTSAQQVPQSSIEAEYFASPTTSISTPSEFESANKTTTASSLASPVTDPNYDPPFPNDVRIPVRKGWESTLHFLMKHSDGLAQATKSYVTSHFEFGGSMADYSSLKTRYSRLRALEDVDESEVTNIRPGRPPRRIRFVNYYTASTGRPKKTVITPPSGQRNKPLPTDGSEPVMEQDMKDMTLSTVSSTSRISTPRISVEEVGQGKNMAVPLHDPDEAGTHNDDDSSRKEDVAADSSANMHHMDPSPVTDDESNEEVTNEARKQVPSEDTAGTPSSPNTSTPPTTTSTSLQGLPSLSSLPPIPTEPLEPPPFNPSIYTDKDARKFAEKTHARQTKAYRQAIKDRDRAIKDRRKLLEKREKTARQEREKKLKLEEKQRLKEDKEELKRQTTLESKAAASDILPLQEDFDATVNEEKATKEEKAKRDKKFCMLPREKSDGTLDKCWVRVYMDGVDEVGAHCGLFIADNPHYGNLVDVVGDRIEDWIREAAVLRDEGMEG